jgi:hypothetical protein
MMDVIAVWLGVCLGAGITMFAQYMVGRLYK